jgi:hypothetical protein
MEGIGTPKVSKSYNGSRARACFTAPLLRCEGHGCIGIEAYHNIFQLHYIL